MSPTVWAVTFGGTLLAAATIIVLACCRAAVREDRAVEAVARAEKALEDIAASNQRALEQIELAYLRGAVSALHKAAQALHDHPDLDTADALRQMADQIILDRPAVWS